jgi:hypothetical protein
MFAIDHAATALLVKRRFPSATMTSLLVSVQAMELAWVTLNYLGIERTTTESRFAVLLIYISRTCPTHTRSSRRSSLLLPPG